MKIGLNLVFEAKKNVKRNFSLKIEKTSGLNT